VKVKLSFPEIARAVAGLDLPPFDLVVGIARGGMVPASLVAYRLGCDLAVLRLHYRDDDNHPQQDAPVLQQSFAVPEGVRTVLLVDDVAVTGRTLEAARHLLAGCDVTTLVLKGRADHVLFPDIRTCVAWPWYPSTFAPQPAHPS
jgi:hypoxanthine phosphoribosyltransferase